MRILFSFSVWETETQRGSVTPSRSHSLGLTELKGVLRECFSCTENQQDRSDGEAGLPWASPEGSEAASLSPRVQRCGECFWGTRGYGETGVRILCSVGLLLLKVHLDVDF